MKDLSKAKFLNLSITWDRKTVKIWLDKATYIIQITIKQRYETKGPRGRKT